MGRCRVSSTILVIEGEANGVAASTYAPAGTTVVSANNLSDLINSPQLQVADGQPTIVGPALNPGSDGATHAAASAIADALRAEGAKSVQFLLIPGGEPLAQVLANRDESRRTTYLANLLANAKARLPRKPATRAEAANRDAVGFFDHTGLLVRQLCDEIVQRYPAMLTRERCVALYRNGVYHIDGTAFIGVVAEILDDRFRPAHRKAVEEFAAGALFNAGHFLPERTDTPLLNVRNGMLDLATGTLKPHDPIYMSSTQLPVEWNPDATCPTYERWLSTSVGDQMDDLEEVSSTMLDPSRTPTKAIFLFGPSRSGKSTYLRLLQSIAGDANYSAVTLHQLADNRFAAANVYGKILNCAADLSSGHVEDMSLFKMMTGEDPVQADRKFGGQFAFVNRALFAFSANELPTVSESSRAYVERIKPFQFPHSFAGSEDPTIEATMLAQELPGILVRWVRAWQRLAVRGGYLKTDERVRHEFEVRSDRVRQFVAEHCKIQAVLPDGQAVSPGVEVPAYMATTQRAIAQAFKHWAEKNGASTIGERKIKDRLTSINGIYEVRRMPGSVRALNLTLRAEADEAWPQEKPDDDLVPAIPAVSTHCTTTPGKTTDLGQFEQGVLHTLSSHGGKWDETAGIAGDAANTCPRCRFDLDSVGHEATCLRPAA